MMRSFKALLWTCLLLCMLGAGGGFAYYMLAPERHMARLVVAAPNQADDEQNFKLSFDLLRGASGESSEIHSQFLFQLTSYETAAELLRDRATVATLLERGSIASDSIDSMQAYLAKTLHINRPRLGFLETSSFVELVVKDVDPKLAKRLLDKAVSTSDRLIRVRRVTELRNTRDEIINTLPRVTTAEYREALVRLLSQTERQRIMSAVNANFAYRVVDPLTVSDRPVEPNLLLSVGLGVFVGFVLSAIMAIISLTRITVFSEKHA